jgi:hypothetical protein
LEDIRDQGRSAQEQQHERPRRSGEGSRGDSPFRSWLPSVPRGDQSLGTLSDSGTIYSPWLLFCSWLTTP